MRRKQFLIIGLGRFGSGFANTLYDLGQEVVAMDSNVEPVQQNMNRVTHAVVADAIDEATLRDIGLDHFDAVIVAIGANIYATPAAKDARARYIDRFADDVISKRILEKIGADKVIRPEFDSGVELAYSLASPKLLAQIDLTDDISVIELEASDGLNGSLEGLGFAKLVIQVIAHARGQTVRTALAADTEIERGGRLALLGRNAALEKLRESAAG